MKYKFNTTHELAHLAGIVELRKSAIKINWEGYPEIRLRMEDKKFLKALKKQFGGTLFRDGGRWLYRVAGQKAQHILTLIEPYARLRGKGIAKLTLNPSNRLVRPVTSTKRGKNSPLPYICVLV